MKERKDVKFRVDMLSDTKSKIIDTKPERDLIHYVWMALVLLAGKVNLEGDLYMSKNIPYTIETLAIEFNRGTYQVKLALDVLMELEMIELTENNVYRVKNFAKHQNIKVKEKNKSYDKEENIKNNEVEVKENLINKAAVDEDEVSQNIINKESEENPKENSICNLEIIHKDVTKIDNDLSDNNVSYNKQNNSQDNTPLLLKSEKNKKSKKRKKKELNIESIDENIAEDIDDCFHYDVKKVEEDGFHYFHNGDEGRPLGEGERIIMSCTF